MCIDILKVLAYSGPSKLTRIMGIAHVNYSDLQEHLGFLTKRNLVEEKTAGKKNVVYVLTESGRSVVETFRELEQMLPATEGSALGCLEINLLSDYLLLGV